MNKPTGNICDLSIARGKSTRAVNRQYSIIQSSGWSVGNFVASLTHSLTHSQAILISKFFSKKNNYKNIYSGTIVQSQ